MLALLVVFASRVNRQAPTAGNWGYPLALLVLGWIFAKAVASLFRRRTLFVALLEPITAKAGAHART